MQIQTLKISTFRNISHAHISVGDASVVALYGENGAGKTSVMEALALFTPGRGLHKTPADKHIQHGYKEWGIFAEIENGEQFTCGQDFKDGRRQIKIDGDVVEGGKLASLGNILWFTPQMDRLFMDSTSGRRDFLDRIVYSHIPSHAETLSQYKHQIKSRLTLLKKNGDVDWIAIHEEQAAKLAEKVWKNRQSVLDALKPHTKDVTLHLHGKMDEMMHNGGDYFEILDHFARNRERDRLIGATHFGPQRSDLTGMYTPPNTNYPIELSQTSTGQHKKAILNILLANARLTHNKTGRAPAILLDEVTAHLDENVRLNLFNELISLGTQIWLTGTEKELFNKLSNALVLEMKSGDISSS